MKSSRASKGASNIAANKKKSEEAVDVEQQFILRVPPEQAALIRNDIQSGSLNLKEKLFIELAPDARLGKVTYDGYIINAKLVDLPCIIETMKTTDNKTFYKTADVCQMLICSNDDVDDAPVEVESPKKKEKDKRYIYNHGICPPLKNCRKRRFRRVLTKKYQEQPDTEKEVKRLFKMDNEALDIKWEIIVEDDKSREQVAGPSSSTSKNIEKDIFGDVISSDENDDDDDDDDNEMMSSLAAMDNLDNSNSQLPG